MKKIVIIVASFILALLISPPKALAAGVYVSGGSTKTVGQTFNATVTASGAEFDSLQGTISVSGNVSVLSVSAGSATWLPGKSPAVGSQFVGIVSPTSSMTVATLRLKATAEGTATVSISGAKLARNGAIVGTDGGSTSFNIQKAANLPGSISVTSATHPDQAVAYEATTIELSWTKAVGVTNFSYLLDQSADTIPPAKASSADTAVTYHDQSIGEHYFHIRAQNADGWGAASHFKITIKEPEPKEDATLKAPYQLKIEKGAGFLNNITDGLVTNILISGKVEPGFKISLALTPEIILPEGKVLNCQNDENGNWSCLIDFPIRSGFYLLTAQGQKDKVLTPKSEEIRFEISQADGGRVNILTEADADKSAPTANVAKGWLDFDSRTPYYVLALIVAVLAAGSVMLIIKRKRKLHR